MTHSDAEAEVPMSTQADSDVGADTATEDLQADLLAHDMDALWTRFGAPPNAPQPSAVPHLWPFADVERLMSRAGEAVSLIDAERRVALLVNPGLRDRGATSATLQANFQLVLPGETARAHRHTMSAVRFVVSGSGAHTTVEGESVTMRPGDLILTPNWTWHDHINDGAGPILWLDGLDRPLVSMLELEVIEPSDQHRQAVTRGVDTSTQLYSGSRLNPPRSPQPVGPNPSSPVANYPWSLTEPALRAAAEAGAANPFDDVILEYTHPHTGGPVTSTIACFTTWLRPGISTAAHRHTTTTIYHVIRGSGTTRIDGTDFHWNEHDTFVVPSWATHEHKNADADSEAILFSYTDEPALRGLGLYREEAAS